MSIAIDLEPGQDKTCSILLTRVRYTCRGSHLLLTKQRYSHNRPDAYFRTVLKCLSTFSIPPQIVELLFEFRRAKRFSISSRLLQVPTHQDKRYAPRYQYVFIWVVHTFSLSHCKPPFQMTLSQKFPDAVSTAAVNESSLYMDTSYPVFYVTRVKTKYEQSKRLPIRDGDHNIIKVLLPLRYSAVFTDEDVADIKGQTVQYYLTYKGKCTSSKSSILQLGL